MRIHTDDYLCCSKQRRGNAELNRMATYSGSSAAALTLEVQLSPYEPSERQGEEGAPERFPLPEKNAWLDKLLDVRQNLTEGGHF